MTDKNYTLVHVIADRTGSMSGAADGSYTKAQRTTDGVRALVTEQRKLPGRTEFSMLTFDTGPFDRFGPGDGSTLLDWTCVPRGGTPLLDAVGLSIVETGERLSKMPEDKRPGRVILVIATDGEENSSREYTKKQITDMIATQRDTYKWDIVFIGADIDAFAEAGSLGVAHASTMSTRGQSYTVGWNVTNDAITRNRMAGTAVAYAAADYQAVLDAEQTEDDKTTPAPTWSSSGRPDRSKTNG